MWFGSDLIKGYICLTENHIFFHVQEDSSSLKYNTCIPFREISAVDLSASKRLLTPECVKVTARQQTFIFAISSRRMELFNALRHLSNVAMQKLAKANNEIEPIRNIQTDLGELNGTKPFMTSPASPVVSLKQDAVMTNRRLTTASGQQRKEAEKTNLTKSVQQLDEQKRNAYFQQLFHLPASERLQEIHQCSFQVMLLLLILVTLYYCVE